MMEVCGRRGGGDGRSSGSGEEIGCGTGTGGGHRTGAVAVVAAIAVLPGEEMVLGVISQSGQAPPGSRGSGGWRVLMACERRRRRRRCW